MWSFLDLMGGRGAQPPSAGDVQILNSVGYALPWLNFQFLKASGRKPPDTLLPPRHKVSKNAQTMACLLG
jgi:hypothetical protein